MAEVIASIASAEGGRGVYIIFKRTARSAVGRGTGRSVYLGLLPWGPIDVETSAPDPATFRNTFAPRGFDRTGDGYLLCTKFPHPDLQVIRILGTTPVKAFFQIQDAGPANSVLVTALYFGAGGNGITAVVSAATSAVAAQFNLMVEKVDATTAEKTTEIFENIDSSLAVGHASYTSAVATSKLIGPLVRGVGLRPPNGTYTLAGGSDGAAVTAANYLGTPSSADKGLALLENDNDVDFVFTDDPPTAQLAGLNAGLKAHAALMADGRIGFTQGLPAETIATARTNVLLNSDPFNGYVFGHCTVLDDTKVSRNIPLTAACSAMACAINPHLSGAIKRREFTKVCAEITSIDVSSNKATKKEAEKYNIISFEKNSNGVFSPYAFPMSDGTPLYVVRMQAYIAFSLAEALEQFRNDPNVTATIDGERAVIKAFLGDLKRNLVEDHIFKVGIVDFHLNEVEEDNTTASIQAGDITHSFQVVLASEQKRIFLVGEINTNVTIATAPAA